MIGIFGHGCAAPIMGTTTYVPMLTILKSRPNNLSTGWNSSKIGSWLSRVVLEYHFGNDYRYVDKEKLSTMGCDTYTAKVICQTEETCGRLQFGKTPLPVDDYHPEFDQSLLLCKRQHWLYRMLLGMARLFNTIGRPDIFLPSVPWAASVHVHVRDICNWCCTYSIGPCYHP